MGNSNMDEADAEAEKARAGVSKYIEHLLRPRAGDDAFDSNRGGRIVRVNRRWLQRLGYKRREVIGRMSVEFLTEESRVWAVRETLSLFWRVGSARSIGYQFVTNEGGVLDVLLDAEAVIRLRWGDWLATPSSAKATTSPSGNRHPLL